jgi:acetylglutamate/LysW-gamma-L-alpha-aminoadipate kinase
MIIIKIGGGEKINIKGIISELNLLNDKIIIVHGANHLRNELAKKLGTEIKTITSVKGFSSVLSNNDLIDLQLMAYAGLKNKRIVELCQQHNINAIGLTGLDGKLIQGKQNKGIRVREKGKLKIVRDNSGKPIKINTELISLLLKNNYMPIITVPIISEDGKALNSENDDIVSLLSNSLKANKVIQFIEAKGLLENPTNEESLIKNLSKAELLHKVETSNGRIKRKLYAIQKLFDNSNMEVIISDGRLENPITEILNNGGTIIK